MSDICYNYSFVARYLFVEKGTNGGCDHLYSMYECRRELGKMHNYKQAAELALMCAYNARSSTDREVTAELWRMAKEYQAEAAKLDGTEHVNLGEPPRSLGD